MGSETDLVLATRHGAVQLLTLNRPHRLNAWTPELEDEYFALLDEAEADTDVGAVVVTGAGKGFCAGADLGNLAEVSKGAERLQRPRPRTRPAMLRKPLIAAINGAVAGLGLVEALYCDVRFGVPDAKFTTAFARRGLIAEYALAWMLPRTVGQGHALDLLLSARVIDGREAHRIGLVDHLVDEGDVVDQAVAYAQDIAENCSPLSLAIIKEQVRAALGGDFASAAEEAEQLTEEAVGRPDFAEGVASHLEKRPPRFAPLGPA